MEGCRYSGPWWVWRVTEVLWEMWAMVQFRIELERHQSAGINMGTLFWVRNKCPRSEYKGCILLPASLES